MKKLVITTCVMLLAACSSSVSMNDIASKMPKDSRTIITYVPSTSNPISDGMLIAGIKMSGSNAATGLIKSLEIDNLNIGISGNNASVNKATVIYALEHLPQAGKNTSLYMLGAASDKADLEKAANSKNVTLHYFTSGN